jgi:ArsR family transcriptional regulator
MTLSSRKRACADRLKMLADETRLSVLRQLAAGPKFVYELNDRLGIEQSLMSHHLRTLRRAGFVTSKRIGKAVQYRLAHPVSGRDEIDLGCCRICFD